MHDLNILAACIKDRKSWDLLSSAAIDAELGTDTRTLLSLVRDYYERDSAAQAVTPLLISSSLERQFQNPKQVKKLQELLKNLPDVSAINVAAEILAVKKHSLGLRLSNALLHNSKETEALLQEYTQLPTVPEMDGLITEEVVEKFQVKDLVTKSFDEKNLIPLYPPQLSTFLGGGVRPGHHILIFAPTEMGKTLLVINMLVGWIKRKLTVLYVGNEDPVEDLMMRYISRVTGMVKKDIIEHPELAQELLEKRNYEYVIFAPLAPGNFRTIQKLVDRYDPDVVVLDQLRNIDVASENRTQALEKAATEGRNLAKRNQLVVVSVSQAADSASGKRILTRGDVDGSNIGIPGQMDLMIGLGGTEEDEKKNERWLSFPKNKISGEHEAFPIVINPQLSMVVE